MLVPTQRVGLYRRTLWVRGNLLDENAQVVWCHDCNIYRFSKRLDAIDKLGSLAFVSS